jgi:hypothetical protein
LALSVDSHRAAAFATRFSAISKFSKACTAPRSAADHRKGGRLPARWLQRPRVRRGGACQGIAVP